MKCVWCDEALTESDRHPNFQEPFHFACGFRSIAGSVAHLRGRCSCCIVGSEEGDPPGTTKREAAMAAFKEALAIRAEERFDERF